MQDEPSTGRPSTPGYFRARPLPWAWAESRLVGARNYWVASSLPDGRPLVRPVWGVWSEGRFVFDSGSRTGTNLTARPDTTVHLESGDEVVIVEGDAELVTSAESETRFIEHYNAKYNLSLSGPPGLLLAVSPRVAFGWLSDPSGLDGGATFNNTGTRWDFRRRQR